MLVSPGVVMARAPCAAQYCTASWGVLPARKAQASLKSRLSQNPQEDRAGKHGEAAAGFADVEQCFEPLASRRLVRSLTGRFLLCQLAQALHHFLHVLAGSSAVRLNLHRGYGDGFLR